MAEEAFQVISEAYRNELSDPRLKGVQLTAAEMTADLQVLKIYYYVDGPDGDKKRAHTGLQSAKGYLKKVIADNLVLRFIPDIRFYFDEGIEKAERLDRILDSLKQGGGMGKT